MVSSDRNHVTEATAITPGEAYRQAREQAAGQDSDYDLQRGLDRFTAWLDSQPDDEAGSFSWDSTTWSAGSRDERPAPGVNPDRPDSAAQASQRKQGGLGRSGSRQARLTVARVDPWSVMKVSFMLSVAGAVVLIAAVAVLYPALSGLGVLTSLEDTITTLTRSSARPWFSEPRILGWTGMISAAGILLVSAGSTLGAC